MNSYGSLHLRIDEILKKKEEFLKTRFVKISYQIKTSKSDRTYWSDI